MKRFFFSAIALMIAATACTESGIIETPDSYGNPIVFDTYIGKAPITKAVDMNGVELMKKNEGNGARLYAFLCPKGQWKADQVDFESPYMDGALYYVTGWGYYPKTTTGFKAEIEEVYWPGWSTDLAFVAYSLNADDSDYISGDNTQFTFTVQENVSEQVDLLVSPLTFYGEGGSETSVNIQLYHLLSRIGFKVLATPGTSTDIVISRVSLCGAFPKQGKVNLMSATNVAGAAKSVPSIEAITTEMESQYDLLTDKGFSINSSECDGTSITDAVSIYDKGLSENNRYMMIMPGTVSNATIEVDYKLGTQSQAHTARIDLGTTNFKAGSAYEYIFKVATASIEFSGVVEGEWDEQAPVEHPLQK